MKKLLLIVGLIVGLSGCKVGCDVENIVSNGLSKGIASGLSCSNQAQIQADIMLVLGKTNICTATQGKIQGAIAMVVCPIIAAEAVSLLGSRVPESWQCNPTNAGGALSGVIIAACNLLPF